MRTTLSRDSLLPVHYATILAFITLLLSSSSVEALTSKVILTEGGSSHLREQVSANLTRIVNSLQASNVLQDIERYYTSDGFISFRDLVEKTNCRNVNPLYETKLLDLPTGRGYEVRDIKVMVDMGETRGNPYHYLVFTLNDQGLICDVRFAMERIHYEEIVKQGLKLKDFIYRQHILQFLEIFRTAYNRKDIDYLRKVYSDDALIIVGKVLKEKPDEPDYFERSKLSRKRIQFIKLSKQQYITSLEQVFRKNEFIKVNFVDIKLLRHPKKEKIYGVTLKQDWHSSTYSDQGYLFLMIDFRDQDYPIIHVRSWQPEKFPDGSVVSLGDFELIE